MTRDRILQLEQSLDRGETINTDFEPRLMNIVFQEWFVKHGTSPRYFFLIVLILTVIYIIFMKKEEYVLFSTGLATMGAEMLIVFAFQVIYGYIYIRIGAIVTAFLLGLLPGALIGRSWGQKDIFKLFVAEMLLLFMLFIFFVWAAYFRIELHPLYFLVYGFLFSLLCGYQFPIAASIIGEKTSPAAGCLAADLCGASVGTLATGTILIPIWGIRTAAVFLIIVKISSSVIVMFTGKMRAK